MMTRRGLLGAGAALASWPWLGACARTGAGGSGAGSNAAGRHVLHYGIANDPTTLTSAFTSAGIASMLSPKLFDGLLNYTRDLEPLPRLAREWSFTSGDRTLTLKLQPGVRWHDGKDFTSGDVAFSALQVWKQYHSRGRMTYAHLAGVDTPDPLTAILRFDTPAPYVIRALAAFESQVLPRHLYEGRDVLTNPANVKPVGTGPFRFAQWERGQFIRFERNPDYWDRGQGSEGKPYLDGIIFRLMQDPAAQAAALETGELHFAQDVAFGDDERLARMPNIRVDDRTFPLTTGGTGLEFNLDLPKFQDVRVRRAIAHAVDKEFIHEKIHRGNGLVDTGPISTIYKDFYTPDVPRYPFDPARAIALLDEAGVKPDAQGVRLSFRLDPTPSGTNGKVAEYIRSALGKVGIDVKLQNQDFATFVKRVYTDRDFEVIIAGGQMGPDPVIGMQRFYWSKSFQPGVAFSNASHYQSAEADRLLEAARVETDPARRRVLYGDFQRVAMTDLPRIPLWTNSRKVYHSAKVSPLPDTGYGTYGSFADLRLAV